MALIPTLCINCAHGMLVLSQGRWRTSPYLHLLITGLATKSSTRPTLSSKKFVAANVWKHQDMAQDFQALLASKHGTKLIRSLMNNFAAKKSLPPQKDQHPITDNRKFPPWQLIAQPSNLNTPIPHARKDYWFCTKCNPPHLVRHKDSEHKTGFKQNSKKSSPMTGNYSANLASCFHQLSSLITAQKEAIAAEADDSDTKQSAMRCMTRRPSKDDSTP